MEFEAVVRNRRMVRSFRTTPIDRSLILELLDLARRAPSAGNTQGTTFLVLDGEDVGRFWDTTLAVDRRPDFPWPRLLEAPVIVLPCGDERAYVDRYAEADKASTGLGEDAEAWGIPYWHVDTAMATMTLLHAAVERELGALFFGLFGNEAGVAAMVGLPDGVRPIGAVALGWPDGADRASSSARRGRRPLDDVVRWGSWDDGAGETRTYD